jgi:hypothetical protein
VLAAARKDGRFPFDLRREHAHGMSVPSGEEDASVTTESLRNPQKSATVSPGARAVRSAYLRLMKISVSNPELVDDLLAFLRRADCEAALADDGFIDVEIPAAYGDEQARMEVDLYLKAWQAAHSNVEAHLL